MKKIVEYLKFVFFILIFVLLVSNLILLKNIMNTLVKIDEEIKIKQKILKLKLKK